MNIENREGMESGNPDITGENLIVTTLGNLLTQEERQNQVSPLIHNQITINSAKHDQRIFYEATVDAELIGLDLHSLLTTALPAGTGDDKGEFLDHGARLPHSVYLQTRHQQLLGSDWETYYNGGYHEPLARAMQGHTAREIEGMLGIYISQARNHYERILASKNDIPLPKYLEGIVNMGEQKEREGEKGQEVHIQYQGSSQTIFLYKKPWYIASQRGEPEIVVQRELALLPQLRWLKNLVTGERTYQLEDNHSFVTKKGEVRANPILGLAVIATFSPEQKEKIPSVAFGRPIEQLQIPLWLYINRDILLESPIFSRLEELVKK